MHPRQALLILEELRGITTPDRLDTSRLAAAVSSAEFRPALDTALQLLRAAAFKTELAASGR